jgi:hypothetical protein
MKKGSKTISIFTFIFLVASFLFAPVNLVMADEASSDKATADSDKDADKKKEKGKGEKGKGKGDDEEEPDCE